MDALFRKYFCYLDTVHRLRWELDLVRAEIQKILSDQSLPPIQQLVKIRELVE